MKILHITEYCHAATVGGTERYILDLIHGLHPLAVENRIGWLCLEKRAPFESEGVRIYPLPSTQMRVDEPPMELVPGASAVISEFRPDLIHFHTFGLAEATIARVAHRQNIPYAFTYHSPAWTCRREDLLIWGKQPCDGKVQALRCSACKVQERLGGPALGGYIAALFTIPLDLIFNRSGDMNFRRRMCFLSDTRRFEGALREFLAVCPLVIACSDWGKPILTVNGARPEHVTVIPQGVSRDFTVGAKKSHGQPQSQPKAPFRIGYIGRVTPVKGVDILAEGFSRVRGEDMRLNIYGFSANEKSVAQLNRKLKFLAQQDARIELHPKLPLTEMVNVYKGLDLLAIPSVWLETGPLVLFEALKMGVPVYGSDRLGHLSLLREGGKVVEHNTADGWRIALSDAADEFRSGQWDKWRERVRNMGELNSMDIVARQMKALYDQLLGSTISVS